MRMLLLISLLLILIPIVSADSNLYIEISEGEVQQIVPFNYNMYYQEKFYFGVSGDSGTESEILTENEIDIRTDADTAFFVIEDIDFSENYLITRENGSEEISFCNDDGQCQPCFEGLCSDVENYLTCPEDCSSGDQDNYCDLARDDICDPDCEDYDFDCDQCVDNVCLYDGMEVQRNTCSDIGGGVCAPREECEGYLTYADDVGTSCCIGECEKITEDEGDQSNKETRRESERQEFIQEDEEEDTMLFYIIGMIVFILVSLVVAIIAQSKMIKTEHQMREYVSNMLNSGYTEDQIRSALAQQNYDKDIIEKVFKYHRRK